MIQRGYGLKLLRGLHLGLPVTGHPVVELSDELRLTFSDEDELRLPSVTKTPQDRETNFQDEMSTNFFGVSTVQRPGGFAAQPNFYFLFFVAISFPNRIDVLGRLCTHFESVKVMTFASVT